MARSGKSTIADLWLNQKRDIYENNALYQVNSIRGSRPRAVVSKDKIRLAMGHRWNGVVEPHVNAVCDTMTRALLLDHDVMLDETHTTTRSILTTLQIQPDAKWFFVDTPYQVCLKRAMETDQPDLEQVIMRMWKNLCRLCNGGSMETIQHTLPGVIEECREFARSNKNVFERITD
jgi:hypothetical protein